MIPAVRLPEPTWGCEGSERAGWSPHTIGGAKGPLQPCDQQVQEGMGGRPEKAVGVRRGDDDSVATVT